MSQKETNRDELCRFICQQLPRHHLNQLLESIEVAFQNSNSHLKTFKHVPLAGPGPQLHHYTVQEALLGLQNDESFDVSNYPTKPVGGHFALISAGSLRITTSVMTIDKTQPNSAKHRREFSAINERLENQHPDLFQLVTPPLGPNDDSLHALLLPYTAKWSESDHSSTLGVVLAVPYSDPSNGFHLRISTDELLQYYDEIDGLGDVAYPKLRASMRRDEERDQNEGGSE
ncbi:hypothetical protein [Vreelandella sp. V005]|uniref:hypothetical protein n=1 Tax=Vreelandella sp. V005 TaxID=3459608 RepID=UPI0040449903